MDAREKLVELIESARYWGSNTSEEIAENLITNGVTVQECGHWVSLTDCSNASPHPGRHPNGDGSVRRLQNRRSCRCLGEDDAG